MLFQAKLVSVGSTTAHSGFEIQKGKNAWMSSINVSANDLKLRFSA